VQLVDNLTAVEAVLELADIAALYQVSHQAVVAQPRHL
jgi:hypothetical protein